MDIIDYPVNTNDYSVPIKQQEPMKPIQSVVEVHQPRNLEAPDSEEVANAQLIPAVQANVKEAVSQV